ncbi:MAG: hypothetical protein ABSD08_10290 [Xanthobacteraceae bacterium]
MELIKRYLEPGAMINCVQVGHRHTAVEYTVAGIAKIHDANLDLLGRDPLNIEMEGSMRDWVIETLLQGAYLREYHLWEKDCKAYFAAMAKRNGEEITTKTKGGQPFVDLVKDTLVTFAVTMPANILDTIEHMRQRVNAMKHEAGLELDHFISDSDYAEGLKALEGFWEYLAGCERIVG